MTRTVVVTGASSGIGRACALRLDEVGWRVFATYRKPADAEALRAAASDRLMPVQLDVADPDSIRSAAETILAACGDAGLDALVNNAGIGVAAPLEFIPLDALRHQFEVNVIGQLGVTQALLPALRKARGRIVNMSSISGRFPAPLVGAYSASKYALEAITDVLRIELRPWDIQVTAIEPGAIDTPIWERSEKRANELRESFPPEAEPLYGRAVEGILRRIGSMTGTPTDPVVDAVVDALTRKRPRHRYVVGRDAKLRLALLRLPTRLREWIVARTVWG